MKIVKRYYHVFVYVLVLKASKLKIGAVTYHGPVININAFCETTLHHWRVAQFSRGNQVSCRPFLVAQLQLKNVTEQYRIWNARQWRHVNPRKWMTILTTAAATTIASTQFWASGDEHFAAMCTKSVWGIANSKKSKTSPAQSSDKSKKGLVAAASWPIKASRAHATTALRASCGPQRNNGSKW
jgi:hypothetical protein